jgi:hypothetical protein
MAHDTAKSRQKQRAKVYDKNIKETFSNPVVQEVALTALPVGSIVKAGKIVKPAVTVVANKIKSAWLKSTKLKTAKANYRKKVIKHIKTAENIKPSIGVEDRLSQKGKVALLKASQAARNNTNLPKKWKKVLDTALPRAERNLTKEIAAHPNRNNPPPGVDLLLNPKVLKGKPADQRSQKEIVIRKVLKSQAGGNVLTGKRVKDGKSEVVHAKKDYIPSGMEQYGKRAAIPNVFTNPRNALKVSQPKTTSIMERGFKFREGVQQRVKDFKDKHRPKKVPYDPSKYPYYEELTRNYAKKPKSNSKRPKWSPF